MAESILDMEKAAMLRWRSGDPWGFVEISAQDILYMDPGLRSPVLNLEDYRAHLRPAVGQIIYQASDFINPQVVMAGDAAVLTYNYRSLFQSPAGELLRAVPWNATEVYFRQAGQWQIVHTHWSFNQQKLAAVVEVPVPVHVPPQPYPGLLAELMALETAAMHRWRKGDPWGFIEISAPEVTYFDTGTRLRIDGRDALSAEYARRAGKIFYDVMDFVDPHVRVCGDLAVLFYRFLSTTLDQDQSVVKRTPWNCSEVFQRSAGEWKIIHTHWSFIGGERAEANA